MTHEPLPTAALSRRNFLLASATGASAALLGGCASLQQSKPLTPEAASGTGGVSLQQAPQAAQHPSRMRQAAQEGRRARYALVGTGSRSYMYLQAITGDFKDAAELVGLCDINQGRLEMARQRMRDAGAGDVPVFHSSEFDAMIAATRPDVVIVTTVDQFHDQYVCRAMELGCDAMTEKPMTTTADKCRGILETQRRTGRNVRVGFNYRYSPPRTQVKDLLMSGLIGQVLSVDFHWLLDTRHGADYFRRWHSNKVNSGGLMVHKATHHFDLCNWWLSGMPEHVVATGKRDFYTPSMARRMGLSGTHERCLTCSEKKQCVFYMDIVGDAGLKAMYHDHERWDGYFRDRCVWRPEIDIEDTMNVLVRYNTGATLCYSLNAFNGWEGYIVSFNGTKGRLEFREEESVIVDSEERVPGAIKSEETSIRIYPMRQPAYAIKPWRGEGGHGGGDVVLLDDLFNPLAKADKYLRAADHRAGAASIMIGIAANTSMQSGQPVQVTTLLPGLEPPDYPDMPDWNDPMPMPGRKA